jgi:type IV pilus assembly protein PilF
VRRLVAMQFVVCALALLLTACVTKTQQLGGDPTSGSKQVADSHKRASIHTQLGAKYAERGQYGVAIEELRKAIAADKDYAPAYGMLGLVYMDLKENDLARHNFERAIRIAPDDAAINNNYGQFLCQTGSPKESIAYFLKALKNPLYETPQLAFVNAGVCSLKFNALPQADDYFQRALRIDPNQPQALFNLAQLRFDSGKFSEARGFLERYHKVTDPSAESLWLALRIERKLGDRGAETSFAAQLRRNFSSSHEYQDFLKGNYE